MTMLARLSRAVPDGSVLPGFALCILVSAAAFGMARFELHLFADAWLEPLVLAIIVGTIVRSVWTPPPLFDAGIDFTAHRILEFAVMLLGLSVSAGMIATAGLALVSGIGSVTMALQSTQMVLLQSSRDLLGFPRSRCDVRSCPRGLR